MNFILGRYFFDMKAKYLSLCILAATSFTATAQIKYRETEKKPTLVPYDSSIAFQRLSPDLAELTLVGQQITFLKLNPHRAIRNKEDSLLDNIHLKAVMEVPYKGVMRGGHFYTPYKTIENKTFKIADYERKASADGSVLLTFTLLSDDRKTLVYQVPEDQLPHTPVIINANFEWLKNQYIGHKLQLKNGSIITTNILDENKEVTLKESDDIVCTDVAIVMAGKQKYGQPFLIVKKGDTEFAVGIGSRQEYPVGPRLADFEVL
ncbi:hypothetical protein SAMN05660909_00851 [Chitinophaga terrae (ex Kim and Jung 2007)]|uniref:Uncharacterized protein n=2 Tax=Chitinophaga terrae (ex Kim and Jung 2007) TaxID=408074 RepID=A0A1H3YM96_9BACT|nr:hypothetical protein SAMN05660909_00851 [Chitinophaga terrae (ex Kim and Jung 2007)]